MNAFVSVLSLLAAASGQIISPYAGISGLGYAGLGYGAVPYGAYGGYPYAAGFLPAVAPVAGEATPLALPAPLALPVSTSRVIAAPALPQTSQFQSQDEFGNLAYGYANINSAKQETGNTYGGVTGSYSYTDANGLVQTVNYIADGLGFRVQATNLPVAPVAAPVVALVQPEHVYTLPVAPVFEGVAPVHEYTLPVAVEDTPEVAAAKAEFQIAFDAAVSREKRSTPAATTVLPAAAALPYAGLGYAGALPYNAGFGFSGYPYAGGYPYAAGYPHAAAGYPYAAAGYPYAHGLHGLHGLNGLHGLTYAAPAAAPVAVVPSAVATRNAVKTVIKNNPGFAESYIVN